MKSISNYEAREIAVHLVDGGWTSEDKEKFIVENEKQDSENVLSPEAIDMIFDEIAAIEANHEGPHWYALHADPEADEGDDDGTFDRDEAMNKLRDMLTEHPAAWINVFDGDELIEKITADDL